MGKEVPVEHYPYKAQEDSLVVYGAIRKKTRELLSNTLFPPQQIHALELYLGLHFALSESFFEEEESLRKMKTPGANLFYHSKEHSLYQATYDALAVTLAILKREKNFAGHVSPEGALAIVLAAIYHDIGYVSGGRVENYAARAPIHVEESKKMVVWAINRIEDTRAVNLGIGLPTDFDIQKLKNLAVIGIHGTHFPYSENKAIEGKKLIDALPLEQRKEAHIVRLAVQFADLGGQCARIDRYPDGLMGLRAELNAMKPGLGIELIGDDESMERKRREFRESVLEKTVGKTGRAFFGQTAKAFTDLW